MSSLLQHHPVGDLNTLLVKSKHELLELLLHLHKSTCSAWVDLKRCAFGMIRHELCARVYGIHFLDQLLPARVVKRRDTQTHVSFTARKSGRDEFINLLNNISFVLDFIGFLAHYTFGFGVHVEYLKC